MTACTHCLVQRLQRELRNLNTKTQLPIHSAAAIFVRHDVDRIDKMRVIITGVPMISYAVSVCTWGRQTNNHS